MASIPTKRAQVSSGTSFEEQAIYYYIKQLFQDAVNRGKYSFNENESIELDIYIPCLHFAIEYDGAYWHKDKADIDNRKNDILSDAGVYLVRVRECGLADLDNKYGDIIYRKTSSKDNGLHLQEVINEIVNIINNYVKANDLPITKEIKDSLVSFHLSKEELIDNRPNIYAQYHTVFQEDNITTTCLINHWDYQKNGNLLPQNVSIKSGIFVVLTCPQGHSFHIQPSRYKLNTKQQSQCKHCMLKYCPAVLGYANCDARNCDTYNSLLETSTYVPIDESNRHSFFVQRQEIQIENSPCTKILIKSPHLLYKKMQKSIAEKLEKSPETISSKTILKWLISLDVSDRFDFLESIDTIGQTSVPSLIDKVKEVLNGKISIDNHFFFIEIDVPDTIPPEVALKFFKIYRSKNFSFSSLKYFDQPQIMDDFCNLLLSECKQNNFVSLEINHFSLAGKIKREYECLSKDFLVRLYKLLERLNEIQPVSEFDKCKELLYSRVSTNLSALEDETTKNIISKIQNCSSATKDQIRSWIDATLSPQREQIIYHLYQKGFLKLIGGEASDSTGHKFSSKELNIDFISDVGTQLSIM